MVVISLILAFHDIHRHFFIDVVWRETKQEKIIKMKKGTGNGGATAMKVAMQTPPPPPLRAPPSRQSTVQWDFVDDKHDDDGEVENDDGDDEEENDDDENNDDDNAYFDTFGETDTTINRLHRIARCLSIDRYYRQLIEIYQYK
jgi:hypothetical protein